MALDVAATTVIYLWASTYLISKQVGPQRRSQGYSRKENQLMYDTVGGWSSVSYFNRQDYEKERYSQAVGSCSFCDERMSPLVLIIIYRLGNFVGKKDGHLVLRYIHNTGYDQRAGLDCCRFHRGLPNRSWNAEGWQLCHVDVGTASEDHAIC